GLVRGRHSRGKSLHYKGAGIVNSLGEVLQIGEPGLPASRVRAYSAQIRKPPRLVRADGMATRAGALARENLVAYLDHFLRRQIGSDFQVLGRMHLGLGHHLADIGVECRDHQGEHQQFERGFHETLSRAGAGGASEGLRPFFEGFQSFFPVKPESQKMTDSKAKKIRTVTETTLAAYPRVGVKASSVSSRITPYTCQCWRIPDRTYPIRPMSQVNVMAIRNSAYWARSEILPQRMAPVISALRNMK